MPLAPGTRLGPYEIVAPIGTGGMGEVWKGRDTRLDRIVAIKVSHEQFSERFDREAHAVAALNHPHICQLYDVGPNYLVMEFIDGVPLKGPMPLDQALKYAAQICDALDAAHRIGIVHRDLKPANILVTRSGVKLLDFGLAKRTSAVAAEETTMAAALTGKGQILGTLQYMSPEQIQGKEADARSDIFSFGLVLYEMLTGKRAFDGASAASVMGAILERPAPSISSVAPQPLDRLLQMCLAKDPEGRWQSTRDLKAELEWANTREAAAPAIRRRALFPWIAGAAAGAAGATGIAAWAWRGTPSAAPARAIRFRLAMPEGVALQRLVTRQSLALSPVGGRVATIGIDEHGPRVWVQRLDSVTASPLAGTEGAQIVFWSPDGQFIGFGRAGKLNKVPAEGGPPVMIADAGSTPWSATWGSDTIVTAAGLIAAAVSLKSGATRPFKSLSAWPKFLPDGRRVLHLSGKSIDGDATASVTDVSSGQQTDLMLPTDTQVIFVPDRAESSQGHLLFGRGSVLQAVRFDADRLLVSGDPFPVAKDVPFFMADQWSEFDASADGILIYSTGLQKEQLTWFDRTGRETGTAGDRRNFWPGLRLSPDGSKLAATVLDSATGGTDIWVYDLQRGTDERVTLESGVKQWPVWSPDGKRLVFNNSRHGPGALYVKALNDRGAGEKIPAGRVFQTPRDWSPDGRWIFYATAPAGVNGEIRLTSLPDGKSVPLLKSPYDSASPALSPDGTYLAFSANDTGRYEIYVQRFQGGDSPGLSGERYRVSRDGGDVPRWRRDGKELFFVSADRKIMAVPVRQAAGIGFGSPVALFAMPPLSGLLDGTSAGYDVSPDGQRFVLLTGGMVSAPLEVVVNWTAGLKK